MPLRPWIGFVAAVLVAYPASAASQDLTVSRNVNLRPDPSTGHMVTAISEVPYQ